MAQVARFHQAAKAIEPNVSKLAGSPRANRILPNAKNEA